MAPILLDIIHRLLTLELLMNKRFLLKATAALAAAASFGLAQAQTTPIKFQMDWRFEGPSAFFLLPAAKGYFKDAKLDVTVDSGNGSGGAVTRVASGTYDLGFADLAALMEFHANNPDAPNKPVAIMMVYNNTPASVMALKKSGIKTPPIWPAKSWALRCLTLAAVLSRSCQGQRRAKRGLDRDGPPTA
jgi:ABC-type nitrate/sulfonate/bicarbonate transport system substrate-binding protein